jgi:hypothetical protein
VKHAIGLDRFFSPIIAKIIVPAKRLSIATPRILLGLNSKLEKKLPMES